LTMWSYCQEVKGIVARSSPDPAGQQGGRSGDLFEGGKFGNEFDRVGEALTDSPERRCMGGAIREHQDGDSHLPQGLLGKQNHLDEYTARHQDGWNPG